MLGWSNIAEKPESHHPSSTLSLLHEALILPLMQQIVELKSTRAQSRRRGAASAPCATIGGRGPPFKYVPILWILCICSNLCIMGCSTSMYPGRVRQPFKYVALSEIHSPSGKLGMGRWTWLPRYCWGVFSTR